MLLILFLIFHIFSISYFTISVQTITTTIFSGEIPIEQYCESLCQDSNSKISIHIVDNFRSIDDSNLTTYYHQTSQLHQHLKSLHCPHIYLTNISLNYLIERFNSTHTYLYFQHRQVLLFIFNFTQQSITSQAQFENILQPIVTFYQHCLSCLPIISLFNLPPLHLYHLAINLNWSSTKLKNKINFRGTFIGQSHSHSVLHYNPIINGCANYPGIYWPQNSIDFTKLKVPYSNCNLNQTTLKVYITHALPFCKIIHYGRGKQFVVDYSIEIELLSLLKEKYNFNVKYFDSKQQDLYSLVGNGEGGAAVAMKIFNNNYHADLTICDISVTEERLKLFDFTFTVFFNEITFISQSPKLLYYDYIYFGEFTGFIVCSILGLVIILLVFLQYAPSVTAVSYYELFFNICGIYLKQSIRQLKSDTYHSIRILYTTVMLSTLVACIYYSSSFYSVLTLPEYENHIDTLEDIREIAQTDSHRLLMRQDSSLLAAFLLADSANDPLFYAIGQHIKRTKSKMLSEDQDEIKVVESSPQNVLLADRMFLMISRFLKSQKPLHIGAEMIKPDLIAFLLPKRSPLRRPFNKIIHRAHEMGLILLWQRNTLNRLAELKQSWGLEKIYSNPVMRNRRNIDGNVVKMLPFSSTLSIFLIWAVGICLSICIFICESFYIVV